MKIQRAKKIFKFFTFIKNIVAIIAIAMIISFVSTTLVTGTGTFFGYKIMNVLTESMEPKIMAGDFIIGKAVSADKLKEGDIAAYQYKKGISRTIVHRIYKINTDGSFIFWGDNNPSPDPDPVSTSQIKLKIIWYPKH